VQAGSRARQQQRARSFILNAAAWRGGRRLPATPSRRRYAAHAVTAVALLNDESVDSTPPLLSPPRAVAMPVRHVYHACRHCLLNTSPYVYEFCRSSSRGPPNASADVGDSRRPPSSRSSEVARCAVRGVRQ